MTRDRAETRANRISEALDKLVGDLYDRIEELEAALEISETEKAELQERIKIGRASCRERV